MQHVVYDRSSSLRFSEYKDASLRSIVLLSIKHCVSVAAASTTVEHLAPLLQEQP
jgi:hypothetical protein